MGDLLTDSGALLSECERYRYRLWRIWDDCAPIMVWVMLNPSTADASQDDPTIRKCIGFAKQHRHGGIIVANLFAYRATNPKELLKVADPVGPENNKHIRWAVMAPPMLTIVAGWGADKFARRRAAEVSLLIRSSRGPLKCFRKSASGVPWHPLYLPYSSPLETL